MHKTEIDRCEQVNSDGRLEPKAFEAAWKAFHDTPINLVADSDDEQCRCVRNAILAFLRS